MSEMMDNLLYGGDNPIIDDGSNDIPFKQDIFLTKNTVKAYYRTRGNKGFFVILEDGGYERVPIRLIHTVKNPVSIFSLALRNKLKTQTESQYFWYEKLKDFREKVILNCDTTKYNIKIK